MSEHTKTPWKVRTMRDDCFIEAEKTKPEHPYNIEVMGDDTDEELYPPEQKKADAEFIVKVVNSHDQLVKLVKDSRRILRNVFHHNSDRFLNGCYDDPGDEKLEQVEADLLLDDLDAFVKNAGEEAS